MWYIKTVDDPTSTVNRPRNVPPGFGFPKSRRTAFSRRCTRSPTPGGRVRFESLPARRGWFPARDSRTTSRSCERSTRRRSRTLKKVSRGPMVTTGSRLSEESSAGRVRPQAGLGGRTELRHSGVAFGQLMTRARTVATGVSVKGRNASSG